MKLETLAKAVLALGLLATGVITLKGQTAQTKEKQEGVQHLYDIKDLHRYCSSESFEFSNISGKVENYDGSNVVHFNQENQSHQLFLLGKDKEKYKEGVEGKDVFVVRELINPNSRLSTVGGVARKNNKSSKASTHLFVNKVYGGNLDASINSFSISKEEVSLGGLDFKIRQHLVKNYGLYRGMTKYGKITINLKDGEKQEINLGDKLQFKRIGDVLDSKDTNKIEVTSKQI